MGEVGRSEVGDVSEFIAYPCKKLLRKNYLREERINNLERSCTSFFLPKLKHELFQELDKSIHTTTSLGAPSAAILP